MIPKIIYTCWLSDINDMPDKIKKCIDTLLKYHQDYEHVIIDYNKFKEIQDLVPNWVNVAFENKDYAHVSDYLRVYFLYKYGGIYLDSDVICIKEENVFDKYLDYDFFGNVECSRDFYLIYNVLNSQYRSDQALHIDLNDHKVLGSFILDTSINIRDSKIRHEFLHDDNNYNLNLIKSFYYGVAIDGAMFGASKECDVLKDALDMYSSDKFSKYVLNQDIVRRLHYYPNICNVLAKNMEKYGFDYTYKYGDTYVINNLKYLLNTDTFISITDYKNRENNNCELIHLCNGSWRA